MPESDRDELRLHVGTELVAEGKLAALTADSAEIREADLTISVPVDEVSEIRVKKTDVGKSILLGVGIAAGMMALFVGVILVGCEIDGGCWD